MEPIVTLGMCMRNCEKWITYALPSISQQDLSHELIEAIFFDDGSDDRTPEIVEQWSKKTDVKTKIIRGRWVGLGKGRNTIINNSSGKYIIWMDSDQIFPKKYVRKQIEFMDKNPDIGIGAGLPLVNNKDFSLVLKLEILSYIVECSHNNEPRNYLFKTRKYPGTGGSIYRVDALKSVNGFDDRIQGIGEDIDIGKRIEQAGWKLYWNSNRFIETHSRMSGFIYLWKRYRNGGRWNHKLYTKDRTILSLPRMSPLGSFVAGIVYSAQAYRITSLKISLLLPIHFMFKMTAWFVGFVESQISNQARANGSVGAVTRRKIIKNMD
ncbi:glycosyltransferase [Candidatus Bathyarchaeota archaeon]|nr:glycosyltransferase [Candidatus Bathyarchaeota archaeon]